MRATSDLRQKAQQIDAARGDIGVGRKGDHRNVARARHLPDDADRLREQRPENDLGAFVERLLRGLPRRRRRVPASSFTRSWIFGELNSASAISAALRIAWPATPALPPADSGRMSATLTWPVPSVVSGTGGPLRRRWRRRRRRRGEVAGRARTPCQHRARRGQQARERAAPCGHGGRPLNRQLRGHSGSPHGSFTRRDHRVAPICHSGGEWLTK